MTACVCFATGLSALLSDVIHKGILRLRSSSPRPEMRFGIYAEERRSTRIP